MLVPRLRVYLSQEGRTHSDRNNLVLLRFVGIVVMPGFKLVAARCRLNHPDRDRMVKSDLPAGPTQRSGPLSCQPPTSALPTPLTSEKNFRPGKRQVVAEVS